MLQLQSVVMRKLQHCPVETSTPDTDYITLTVNHSNSNSLKQFKRQSRK